MNSGVCVGVGVWQEETTLRLSGALLQVSDKLDACLF